MARIKLATLRNGAKKVLYWRIKEMWRQFRNDCWDRIECKDRQGGAQNSIFEIQKRYATREIDLGYIVWELLAK